MGFGTTKALSDGSGFKNTIRGGVEIRISMKDVARRMRRVRAELPKLRERAFKTQMGTILSHMRKAMQNGGGIYDVPKFKDFEQFTKDVRSVKGNTSLMGGWLASKNAFKYDALTPFSSPRPKVRIGWLKGAEDAATKFQLGTGNEPDPFTVASQRYYWHKLLATDDLPSSYVHHERQLIIPFERHVCDNLQKWIDGYVRKTIAHQIAKEMRGNMK